jgi:hypothetical protein
MVDQQECAPLIAPRLPTLRLEAQALPAPHGLALSSNRVDVSHG